MISAFGPNAQRYAAALGGLDAIVADPEHVATAYIEAIARRERGEPFYGMVLFDEPRTRAIELIAPAVLAQIPGFDERRAYCDLVGRGEANVNGRPAREVFADLDPGIRLAAQEFLLLANAALVRSHADYARLTSFFHRPRPFERVVVVPAIPAAGRRAPQRPAVVVWVAHRPAACSALYAFALAEFHGDVTLVVGDGPMPSGLPGTFLHHADARVAAALAGASAVVATDAADPGVAIAFAQRGYGVAAPLSSGASEYVGNAVAYDPGTVRTIQVAASMAVAQPAVLRDLPPLPPPAPAIAGIASIPSEPPLVSIVVPTYNRRADLAACLGCIAAQTYPNVEVVVVNDAGEAVDDIVARFPFARLLERERNGGANAAMVAGLALARGEFVQILADDDWLYPDHLMRLVAALLTSGASIAHSNGVIRHQRRGDDGKLRTIGYNAGVFLDTTTPTDALIATAIVLISVLFRRSVFDEIEPMRDIILADHEIQLRAAERFVFAYVDHATVEWRLRGESSFAGMDSPAGMRYIFHELHPRPERPAIEKLRAASIENVARRAPGPYMFPPSITIESA